MDDGEGESIALISVHPQWARGILTGQKRVEFRKAGPRRTIGSALLYATSPEQVLVAVLRLDRVERGTPQELWERHGSVGGVPQDVFASYYRACQTGTALVIGEVLPLRHPLRLAELSPGLRAPQSFRYLSARVLGALDFADGCVLKPTADARCPEKAVV